MKARQVCPCCGVTEFLTDEQVQTVEDIGRGVACCRECAEGDCNIFEETCRRPEEGDEPPHRNDCVCRDCNEPDEDALFVDAALAAERPAGGAR